MKLICNGNDLSDAVGKVYKAVSSRTTSPILEGIKLVACDNTLTLTATDLELAIEKSISADVKIEGETVVPGRVFSEFVKKLTREQIELVVNENNQIVIKYSGSEGKLQCMDVDEYPQVKQLSDAQSFVMLRNELRDMIAKVAFSVSADDARPILKGVCLEIEEHSITAVALDGYRLARCTKPIEKTSAMMSAVVPARCVNEIARLLEDNDEPVEVSLQKSYIMVDLGHTRITGRLLDGDYLNYKQLIPHRFATTITIPSEQFEAGLERAMLLSRSDKSNLVKFDIRDNTMQISSNSDMGNITENIIVKLEGDDIAIAFNARYFIEILRYIQCDNIVIQFTGSVGPCLVLPSGSTEDFMYLILPVRMAN